MFILSLFIIFPLPSTLASLNIAFIQQNRRGPACASGYFSFDALNAIDSFMSALLLKGPF